MFCSAEVGERARQPAISSGMATKNDGKTVMLSPAVSISNGEEISSAGERPSPRGGDGEGLRSSTQFFELSSNLAEIGNEFHGHLRPTATATDPVVAMEDIDVIATARADNDCVVTVGVSVLNKASNGGFVKKFFDLFVDGFTATSALPATARAVDGVVQFETTLVTATREVNFELSPRLAVVDAFEAAGNVFPLDCPVAGRFTEDVEVGVNSALFTVNPEVSTPGFGEGLGEVVAARTRSDEPELLPVGTAGVLAPFEGRFEKGHGFLQFSQLRPANQFSSAEERFLSLEERRERRLLSLRSKVQNQSLTVGAWFPIVLALL